MTTPFTDADLERLVLDVESDRVERKESLSGGAMGYVQRFGMGLEIARRRCAENGNPEPAFEFSPSAVLAVVRKRA